MNEKEKESMRTKKVIAPIIIALIMLIYLLGIVFLWSVLPIPLLVKVLLVVIPLALAGVIIFVLVERINEIRSGEEDDLSQY